MVVCLLMGTNIYKILIKTRHPPGDEKCRKIKLTILPSWQYIYSVYATLINGSKPIVCNKPQQPLLPVFAGTQASRFLYSC